MPLLFGGSGSGMYGGAGALAFFTGGTITGTNVPYSLAKWGLPFIIMSSGSVDATGNITGITALPLVYPSAYCYFPANALATVKAAGWYYCTFSTTTAGVAFLDSYTSGTPTIPSSPTPVTDGKGAYTGVTTAVTAISVTLPANAMGINGYVDYDMTLATTNSANNKALTPMFGATNVANFNLTTSTTALVQYRIRNSGIATKQIRSGYVMVAAPISAGGVLLTVDTTAAVTLAVQMTRALATENYIMEDGAFTVSQGS